MQDPEKVASLLEHSAGSFSREQAEDIAGLVYKPLKDEIDRLYAGVPDVKVMKGASVGHTTTLDRPGVDIPPPIILPSEPEPTHMDPGPCPTPGEAGPDVPKRYAIFVNDKVMTYGDLHTLRKDSLSMISVHEQRIIESLWINQFTHVVTNSTILYNKVMRIPYDMINILGMSLDGVINHTNMATHPPILPPDEPCPTPVKPEPENIYLREILPGVHVDVYQVIVAFGVTCPALAHAVKKCLAPGQRGVKSSLKDRSEAIKSIKRSIELGEC